MLVSILPSDIISALGESSPALKFLKLPHPRTNAPVLFLPHDLTKSILEVQAIAPQAKRSWFMNNNRVSSDGKLLIMTPVDPIFLLIPLLTATGISDKSLGNFRPLEDIFEDIATRVSADGLYHSEDIIHLSTLAAVKEAFERLTDRKVISDEITVYRFSREKLLNVLSLKIQHLSQSRVFQSQDILQRHLIQHALLDEKEELQQACRIRTSCEVLSQYVPENLLKEITPPYDAALLDEHIQRRAAEFLPKTASGGTAKPAKDPKKETKTNGKRKAAAQLSKGVSKLMKVNTNGMTKLSSFFTPKPAE